MAELRRRLRAGVPGWLPLAAVLAVVVVIALVPDVAFARGGGGGHGGGGGGGGFGGGGGGGGHGGGSGGFGGGSGGGYSGGSGGLGLLPFLFFGGGGSFILLIVLMLLLTAVASRGRRARYPGPAYAPEPIPLRALAPSDAAAGLAAIREADAAFDAEAFLSRVKEAFVRLQQAWQDQDLKVARGYMGEGVYLSWQTQIEQMAALNKKNFMDDVAVLGTAIVSASHGARHDHVSVRIDAAAADYEVDVRTGEVVFGDKMRRGFTEYWTFERSAGTATPARGGLLDQVCPNCGAPLKVSEVGECEYCGAGVTSGRYDWVLARIDQADDWAQHAVEAAYSGERDEPPAVAPAAAAGIRAIATADPGFDPDTFLERAEMAFFLVEKAGQDRAPARVRSYFAPALYQDFSGRAAAFEARHEHHLMENLNVQGVQIVDASHDAAGDRVRVEFDAVAAEYEIDDQGRYVSGDRSDRRFREEWTFARPAGKATPEQGGVLAHRCPNCGKPLALDETGKCSACGVEVTAGTFDWALTEMKRRAA